MYSLKMNKFWSLSGAQYGLVLVRVMSADELKGDCFSPAISMLKIKKLDFITSYCG